MIPVIIFTDKIAGLSVVPGLPTLVEGTKDTMEQRKYLHVHYAERGDDVYDIDKTSVLFIGRESSESSVDIAFEIFEYLELVN